MRQGTRAGLVILAVAALLFVVFGGAFKMIAWKFSDSSHATLKRAASAAARSGPVADSMDRIDGLGAPEIDSAEVDEDEDPHAPEEGSSSSSIAEEEDEREEASAGAEDVDVEEVDVSEEGVTRAGSHTGDWDNPLLHLPTPGQLGQPSSKVNDMQSLRAAVDSYSPGLLKNAPERFLEGYKNPCWEEGGRVRCLPLVYFAGVFQGGTRDLFSRMMKHPDVIKPGNPSFHFWIEMAWDFEKLVELYDSAASKISQDPSRLITFNGSPGTFTHYWAHAERTHLSYKDFFAECWKGCMEGNPGKQVQQRDCIGGCFEPGRKLHTEAVEAAGMNLELPHFIRAAHGTRAKFVVLLRNPTERLHYSYYFHHHYWNKYGKTPEGFFEYAREQIGLVQQCHAKRGSWRECILAFESVGPEEEKLFFHADQVCRGAYAIYLEDWLKAFPRENLLFIKAEEYFEDPAPATRSVMEFLGLAEPDAMLWRSMTQPYQSHSRVEVPEMLPEARDLVDAFYAPFNRALAEMLGEPKYVFED
mmetsp:Transcript_12594/g.39731  ORF Transcript_12594/g.39731 Transcript_12594/m.39731 type:complete len:529 (+) Transcript_12594:1190-2776(+)